ncbi:MAG: PAS domain-containing sensor histidine kinase, partial [Pseudomonadota bacterium]
MTTFDDLWSSLPIPALTLTPDDMIGEINPAAEAFLNQSWKGLQGRPVWDKLRVDAPLDSALERARSNGVPLFVNDVDVGSGARPPKQCNTQIAPLQGSQGEMLFLIEPREHAGRVGRNSKSKTAAKSAIGMAEMLAHE